MNEINGDTWRMIHNDTTLELADWPDECVDLIATSIPFGDQYEYSPSLNDFGHNENNGAFWEQMDFLTPNLLRVLKPGRICAVHVKDRIRANKVTGVGCYTVDPFSDDCSAHFRRHGFRLMARITIDTDVVRENNQTYRLGFTEMSKDGTKMGAGVPEYVLVFRKEQSDTSQGFADVPVTKNNGMAASEAKTNGEYSLAHWQIDAAGTWKSSGDRLPPPEVLAAMPHSALRSLWQRLSQEGVYSLEEHQRICQTLLNAGALPTTHMLFAPVGRHPDVWTDISRISTLNTEQALSGREKHVCPLQRDIVKRLIQRYSNPGEVVFDPFGGIGTVPHEAVLMGRKGWGCELNRQYFEMACGYLMRAAAKEAVPTLFDLQEFSQEEAA